MFNLSSWHRNATQMIDHVMPVLMTTLPAFLVVLVGVGLRWFKVVGRGVDRGLAKLFLNVLLPCFIFHNIVGSDAASDLGNVLKMAAIGFGVVVASLGIVYAITPLLGLTKGEGRRSFTVGAGLQSYGYMPVPLLLSLFDDKELLATLFLHNLGVDVAIYSVVIMILVGKFSLNPKYFLKGPVVAVIIGVLINVTGFAETIPAVLNGSIVMLGKTAIPLSLIMVGMVIANVFPEIKFSFKMSSLGVLLRLFILPSLMLTLAYFLPVDTAVKQVLLIQAAMPAALIPIVLARHYGGKPALVAEVAIVTTIVSFLTMPLVIVLGSRLLGIEFF